jgi:Transposase DDE domain
MIMKELELIRLYFYLCECNDKLLCAYCQRFSPNAKPSNEKLTDAELLTIYFYCRRYEGKQSKTDIYDYAKRYLKSWFPDLPAYANFNLRLNNLGAALPYLVEHMLLELQSIESQWINEGISLIDSLPIMLCSGKRRGKVAPELSEKSYCATKGIYYFGLKLHARAFYRKGKLPMPDVLVVTSAAENDLEVFRSLMPTPTNQRVFGDKAYADEALQNYLVENANACILTPIKLVKGETQRTRQFKKAADDLFSTAVSSVRQPIESFFNWLIEKTDIQNASKVRSTKGAILHTFGAIAAALTFWIF